MVKKRTIIEAWNDFVVDIDDKEAMWEAVLPVLAAFDGKKIRLEASDITRRDKALEKAHKSFVENFVAYKEEETLFSEKIRRPRSWPDPPSSQRLKNP